MLEQLEKMLKEAEESYDKAEPIVDQFLRSADGMTDAEFGGMLATIIEKYCRAMEEDAVDYAKRLAAKIEFAHFVMDIIEKAADKEQEGEDE